MLLVAWLYVRGHRIQRLDAAMHRVRKRIYAFLVDEARAFIDNIIDTENALCATTAYTHAHTHLEVREKIFCVIPADWISHDRSMPR